MLKPVTREQLDFAIELVKGNDSAASPDPRPPEFSDEALALRFAEIHSGDLRYVAAWNKWFRWDGICWQSDDTLMAFDFARHICRAAAVKCKEQRDRKSTRLNSSHRCISYAVFCLKKKKL